jgi:hypothetical protein
VKSLLLLAVIAFFLVTIVIAVVFRDRRARGRIQFLVKVGWAYVIVILVLAAWRMYEGGL